jgi:hypothetical protein
VYEYGGKSGVFNGDSARSCGDVKILWNFLGDHAITQEERQLPVRYKSPLWAKIKVFVAFIHRFEVPTNLLMYSTPVEIETAG